MESQQLVNRKKVRISELRKLLGISQLQMAEQLRVTRTSITHLENGRSLEWLERAVELDKLCAQAGLRLSDLLLPSEE